MKWRLLSNLSFVALGLLALVFLPALIYSEWLSWAHGADTWWQVMIPYLILTAPFAALMTYADRRIAQDAADQRRQGSGR